MQCGYRATRTVFLTLGPEESSVGHGAPVEVRFIYCGLWAPEPAVEPRENLGSWGEACSVGKKRLEEAVDCLNFTRLTVI